MRLPRDITPGAAARRALLADVLVAIVLALVAIGIAAGIGIVGAVALLVFLFVVLWYGVEAAVRRVRRRLGPQGAAPRRKDGRASVRRPDSRSAPRDSEQARGAEDVSKRSARPAPDQA